METVQMQTRPTREKSASRLPIRVGNRILLVDTQSIGHVEADGNYVTVMANGSRWAMRKTLAQMEAVLDAGSFLRISRSSIVNTGHIREIRCHESGCCDVVLADGSALRCSRKFRRDLKRVLMADI